MIVLVPDKASEDEVNHLATTLLSSTTVTAEVGDRSPAEEVARARERHGGEPLGYVARSDGEALEAIAAGADEALCVWPIDARGLLLLTDRTMQRAALRRAQENERTYAVQSEKLAALGTVVAGVAHEINNPLTGIMLSTQMLDGIIRPVADACAEFHRLAAERRAIGAEEMARLAGRVPPRERALESSQVVQELTELTRTIADIVRDLRIYARSDDDEVPQPVNVIDLVEQVLRVVGREITTHGHLERDYGEAVPPVVVPRSRVVQVLTNVLVNAAQAIHEVQRPLHRVRITVRADAEAVAIAISDTGPGIPSEALERIFDPFYTSKREGVGTGLGLSISRAILQRLGGELLVESVHGVGATFIAMIPLPDPSVLRDAYLRSSSLGARSAYVPQRASVLVVDDDARLLRIYPRILRDRYEVLIAADGQEAIDVLSSGSRVDVVLADLVMPEVDGRQLLTWLTERRPDLSRKTVFMTALADDPKYGDFFARLPNPVLAKPVSQEDLFGAIDGVMHLDS